ncbi:hypothetical protein [uncultured Psychroserpens sp.]|uniref:hypothetical protein n=1 Tax=uncultured Psychroserpens sp. TaxID=255436 RepID=UPI002602CC9E|nr:hypothetical protein [uncultured Psychroserpens sp.]
MKQLFSITAVLMLTTILSCTSCSSDDSTTTTTTETINSGNDPNFSIVANNDGILSSANRKVVVFGIDIYAVSDVSNANLLHAANVMAQYLDNDEDGTPDNQAVVDQMTANQAFLFMWASENDLDNIDFPNGREGQDLGNEETNPTYVSSGLTGRFDAALEEVWHIITHAGYSQVYPNVFGEQASSQLSNAMDIARGGQFTSIPNPYPAGAWYTYDDSTCDYNCMNTEYFYWAMTSILGAQATDTRLAEIQQEWDLNTQALVQNTDTEVYGLLTDAQYNLPTVLPDGTYRQ